MAAGDAPLLAKYRAPSVSPFPLTAAGWRIATRVNRRGSVPPPMPSRSMPYRADRHRDPAPNNRHGRLNHGGRGFSAGFALQETLFSLWAISQAGCLRRAHTVAAAMGMFMNSCLPRLARRVRTALRPSVGGACDIADDMYARRRCGRNPPWAPCPRAHKRSGSIPA
jgi:hypothetical protein